MGFDTGTATFQMMELPRPFPEDWLERFANLAGKGVETLKAEESLGWVTGRHLLDTAITEERATLAGWVYLFFRVASRKVPATLLRAECAMEEQAVLAAGDKRFLKASERKEIRDQVKERLLPNMPPSLKGFPFLHRRGTLHLYMGALGEEPAGKMGTFLDQTLGFHSEFATPEYLAEQLKDLDADDLDGTCFSPEMKQVAMEPALGREFLTWLWFKSEEQNGKLDLPDGRECGVLVEGPLTFRWEGNGAFMTQVSHGTPETSLEAKSCLLAGKKLASAKLTFALDEDRIWRFNVDADQFLFRSLKLPDGEPMDRLSAFDQRMQFWDDWREMWRGFYGAFLDERATPSRWRKTTEKMREWVAGRPARR